MGMDVFARKGDGCFRNNVWWWHPLANYIIEVAPDIAKHCKNWHTNDGDGLNAEQAEALADVLEEELRSGRTESYARRHQSALEQMPNEPCDFCGGTGRRAPPPKIGPGDQVCNACNGEGYVRPWATNYPFYTENVEEFIGFLRTCGGFEIC